MAGTALNENTNFVAGGKGKIWMGLAIPATGSFLTIDSATGTPDATENPSAKNVGLTKAGCVCSLVTTQSGREADELTDPYRRVIETTEASIEGELLQVLDFAMLALLIPGVAAVSGVTPTRSGLTFGGAGSLTPQAVAVIFPRVDDPTKWACWMLYQAINESGMKFSLNKKEDAGSPFKFVGQAISSRPANDRTGQFFKWSA